LGTGRIRQYINPFLKGNWSEEIVKFKRYAHVVTINDDPEGGTTFHVKIGDDMDACELLNLTESSVVMRR
jgi:hypothetical protein